MLHEYWREKLDRTEKKLYDNMVSVFSRYEEQVSCGNLAPEAIQRIYMAVYDDHPELYHLPYNPSIRQITGLFGANATLNVSNVFSASQIRKIDQQIESVYKTLSEQLGGVKTDLEREQAVCEYLIANTTYEINNLYNQNAATVICNHKGQCSGIAKAAKLLLNRFGIETIIVNGTASDASTGIAGPHTWNIVKIDGVFFHLDVTFLIGGNLQKSKPYRFMYCNYSDDDIRKDHVWDERGIPRCHKTLEPMNVVDVSQSASTIISSLFELRSCLKKYIVDCEHNFVFESRIQLPTEKLMSAVQKCCRDVISSLGQKLSMKISIQGNVVTIGWQE